jgi:hypothetical protein
LGIAFAIGNAINLLRDAPETFFFVVAKMVSKDTQTQALNEQMQGQFKKKGGGELTNSPSAKTM